MSVEVVPQDALLVGPAAPNVVPLRDADESGQLDPDHVPVVAPVLEEGDHAVEAQGGNVDAVHVHQAVANLE